MAQLVVTMRTRGNMLDEKRVAGSAEAAFAAIEMIREAGALADGDGVEVRKATREDDALDGGLRSLLSRRRPGR